MELSFTTGVQSSIGDPVTNEIDLIRFLKDYPRELEGKNYNWVDKAFKPAVFSKILSFC